ncbi:hypothetical protein Cgig2_033484 [Carnegiea gigantea]|uniref:Reverse transcriptase zinc-binding domain-containing protein n=1 Tax=Carnegiea gigantea TaxID=171969 RepID=A0A9Q1GLN2_9CARY|nr:hypothetical protein Cgig2_033484 [Carnegiea gigantea]
MRELNSASMAKLGWRMLREPASLWDRLLYHKYCRGRRGTDMFMTCCNHATRGGRWVTGQHLVELAIRPVPSLIQQRTVSEYWERSSDILNHLALMQVYPEAGIQDKIFWGRMSLGEYSIQSAIQILQGDYSADDQEKWRAIWRIKAPQKMKSLLWVVLHGAMMTNEIRVKRRFVTNQMVSNIKHTTRDPLWPMKFTIIVWSLWHWRNERCFGKALNILFDKIRFLSMRFVETSKALLSLDL